MRQFVTNVAPASSDPRAKLKAILNEFVNEVLDEVLDERAAGDRDVAHNNVNPPHRSKAPVRGHGLFRLPSGDQ